jgi:putative sterol carrier protein
MNDSKVSDNVYKFMEEFVNSYNNKGFIKDKNLVFEFCFSDVKKSFQLEATPNKCILKEKAFVPYDFFIEIPFKDFYNLIKKNIHKAKDYVPNAKIIGTSKDYAILINLFDAYYKEDKAYVFMVSIAHMFKKEVIENEKLIFEMYFNDLDETYQLDISSKGCVLKTQDFSSYNTKIETSFETLNAFANGTIDPIEAVLSKMFKLTGEPNAVIKFFDFFDLKSVFI